MTVDLESRKKQKIEDQDEYMDNMDVDLVKLEEIESSESHDFQTLLKLYYQKYFPFKDFYNWLSYGNNSYLRFLSFKDSEELKAEILRLCPIKIDIGAIYNIKPKDKKTVQASAFVPLERELVFDIDMTDYDDIRTCCEGANICLKCWNFMTVSIQIIHRALEDDFGFKHILWVFSGRRGIHCWVCDDKARLLTVESRKAIVNYLELLKGGESQARKVNTRGSVLHPLLEKSLGPCATHFDRIMLDKMGILNSKEHWSKLLAIIPDESIRNELDNEWSKSPDTPASTKWDMLQSRLKGSKKSNLEYLARDILFQYSYPRLDSNVSIGLNHLLKSPFCVHPKTGKVCIPINPKLCHEFNPTTVPTLNGLFSDDNTSDFLLTIEELEEFKAHVEYFKNFTLRLQEARVAKLREQQKNSLDF
ncbi:hypothetical protein HK103_003337 [Boothiomyces macroporosus]|uniref:DNA primase n=1 Tax=Boothiomyces macroporosus TaxID=261099 RepID=A0AAD5UI06_9FUNG|nr:hypothetical protein HK103_003337 [Boothiomyces macroporosus]